MRGSGAVRARGISALEDRWRTRRRCSGPTSCLDSAASDALADQIAASNGRQPIVRVVGLLDRSGYIFDPKGLRRRLHDLAHKKDAGSPLFARRTAG